MLIKEETALLKTKKENSVSYKVEAAGMARNEQSKRQSHTHTHIYYIYIKTCVYVSMYIYIYISCCFWKGMMFTNAKSHVYASPINITEAKVSNNKSKFYNKKVNKYIGMVTVVKEATLGS